uniref:G_PROTEIN_RECEP_F3_4 domain-containing protein n=1 Tax=Macrostomum lignano TaxID=282301 RepID=A0A1I8F612_9PLAT
GSAPVDSPRILSKLVHASLVSAVVSGGLSACGACLTLAAMAVNLWFRKVPYIRLSSPIVNTIIGLGCLLCHASCLIMTFNAYMGSQLGLCWSQLLCLITGYSCAFGGILAKTWRTIKDWHLCMVIAAILLMDAGLLLALGLLDSPALAVKRLSEQDMISDGAVVLHKLVVCQSSSEVLWKGLIIGMKAVFLLFGIFFAWRDSHNSPLNDSKVIGICVYNTTVMGLIGVVLEFALPIGSVDLRLVLLTCCINICSATTVLLVFGGRSVVRVLTILKDRRVRVADANTGAEDGLANAYQEVLDGHVVKGYIEEVEGTVPVAGWRRRWRRLKAFVDGYLSGSNKALMLGASFSQQSQVIAELARYSLCDR